MGTRNLKSLFSKQVFRLVLLYTCFFAISLLIVVYKHIISGRTFVWLSDPWYQHYKAYIYIQSFYKNIIKNLIYNHSLIIPLWDMSIGEGSDVINTFCYYGLTDPFNIVGLIFPSKYVLLSFHIMIISKLFFAGISFLYMCKILINDEQRTNIIVIISSILYAFCSWNIYNLRRHHMFINALVFLPLIISGIELLIRNKKTLLIIVGVFLISISNLYYLYVSSLVVGVYTIIRLFIDPNVRLVNKLSIIMHITRNAIIGVIISSFIFIPSAYYFINDVRKNVKFEIKTLYPINYYINFFKNFIIPSNTSYWLVCGYGFISIIPILYMFVNKKRFVEKILLLISIIFMLFPFFGQIFNAFSYVSNKWVWAVSILVHYIICHSFCIIHKKLNNIRQKNIFTILYVFFAIIVTIMFNSHILNMPNVDNNYLNCGKYNDINDWILNDDAKILKDYKLKSNDTELTRYDTDYEDWNVGFLKNMPNISYYWTLTNKYLVDFRQSFYGRDAYVHVFTNYDNRLVLDAISSVKYFVHDKNKFFLPRNSKLVDENKNFDLYKYNDFCNISYVQEKCISKEDFDKLKIGEKEIAILNACIVDNNEKGKLINSDELDFSTIVELYNKNSGYINTKRDNNYINIPIDRNGLKELNYEYKLVFENLNYEGDEDFANISIFGNNNFLNSIVYHNKNHQHYSNIHNFAANLKIDNLSNVTLIFDQEGVYTYDAMYIFAMPVEYIFDSIKKLNGTSKNYIISNNNEISGNIEVNNNGVLVLSIPYTKFWKIYVDNEEVPYFNANLKYIGIDINRGKKNIKLIYDNKLFSIGCIISFITILAILIKVLIKK